MTSCFAYQFEDLLRGECFYGESFETSLFGERESPALGSCLQIEGLQPRGRAVEKGLYSVDSVHIVLCLHSII